MQLDDFRTIVAVVTAGRQVYLTGLHAVREFSELLKIEKTRNWVDALLSSEFNKQSYSWSELAHEFWQQDTAGLMNSYYRGTPAVLAKSLIDHAEELVTARTTHWMLDNYDMAVKASQGIAVTLSGNLDEQRIHRLQVFPVLPAIQCLYLADRETNSELCARIDKVLEQAQLGTGSFTLSGRDQILQIVPQILTDQLISGVTPWSTFSITDALLDRLLCVTREDLSRAYETGSVLTLQFLVYYDLSLAQRPKTKGVVGQRARIDDCCRSIGSSGDPFCFDKKYWIEALKNQGSSGRSVTPMCLARQSTSALIAHANGSHPLTDELVQLCCMTNLRAAAASYGLDDEDDRLARVRDFFGQYGITKSVASAAVERFVDSRRTGLVHRANEFIASLTNTVAKVVPDETTFATSPGHNIADLFFQVAPLVSSANSNGFHEPSAGQVRKMISKSLARFLQAVRGTREMKREQERREIEDIVSSYWDRRTEHGL